MSSLPKQLPPQEKPLESSSSHEPIVTLVRHHRRRHLQLVHPPWYRNSLLASTGYLEFANAGDFAANVWNEIPVPRHAVILMAIGGPLALFMSLVALRDGLLSWQNVRLLRSERRYLQFLKHHHHHLADDPTHQAQIRLIDARLGVGVRELGTELIDRIAMDVFLGIGALLVGTGTLMAIWGAHPRVFHASNLLSGFVGNAFAAGFGVVNAVWSVYLVWRFRRHDVACAGVLGLTQVRNRLHLRFKKLQWHAVVSGVTGLVAGAASMITAKRWWGYVILIPCMVLQVACNWLWRVHLGYDRPVVSTSSSPQGFMQMASIAGDVDDDGEEKKEDATVLLDSLASTIALYNALMPRASTTVEVDWSSLDSLLQFMVVHDLFDSFCAWVAHDRSVSDDMRQAVFRCSEEKEVAVSPGGILRLPEPRQPPLRDLCRDFLQGDARTVLLSRERYLVEMLGCYVARVPV
ncbi:hypothetical protein FE257_011505 [Aspergillus nanangensis]|uniref:Integral membrane protein n=1 Tax=Aspergillus nanangensis TaxID=2582783 RepID=A0AAD4GRB8_ASPNN|nr:hypothetical protein FE257_011505 [Aspergillus nanangensis]